MSSEIRIDERGAGDWVMSRVQGFFTAGRDHSITIHDGSEVLGGFVLQSYMGPSAVIHVAGDHPGWCNREILWMVFDYAFVQLGCRKLLSLVKSTNYEAMHLNLRAGWRIEAILRDVFVDAHMVILSMVKDECPWLDYTPERWRSGGPAETPV